MTQIWKSKSLTVDRHYGEEPGTVVLQFSGPFTARDMYSSISPLALRKVFEPEGEERPAVQILDLSGVPYIDSAGLGVIVDHFSWCKNAGVRMMVVGAAAHVAEQFRITKLDSFLPIA